MQKVIEFYHQKKIDMLRLGCTSTILANICLHKSTDSKFYPFTESDKDLLEKIRGDMVGGPSLVFTRKAVVDETFIRKSTNSCKPTIGIDASQLYPYSMCQPMPTRLYTRWNYDTESQKFMPRQNKTRYFEHRVLPYFQWSLPDCKNESNVTTGRQKKIDCSNVVGTCYHCFWRYGVLLSLLSMWRSSPVIDWQRKYEGVKKEGTRPNAQRIFPTERIQNSWNVGVQWVGIIPNWCDSKKSSSSKISLSTTSQRGTTRARD